MWGWKILIAILLARPLPGGEQAAPRLLWERRLGGANDDDGHAILEGADGGFIILGSTKSSGAGKYDFYLIGTDPEGREIWSRTYGGAGDEWGKSVVQVRDGGYVLTGPTDSFGAGEYDVYLVRTGSKGEVRWTRTFGGPERDLSSSVVEARDGGFVIAGETTWDGESDLWLLKVDADGRRVWSRTYGGGGSERAYGLAETADGGYVLCGETWSVLSGGCDAIAIRTDGEGIARWAETYTWSDEFVADSAAAILPVSGGGFAIAGQTASRGEGLHDALLLRTDEWGRELWSRTFGGRESDAAFSFQEVIGGGYILCCHSQSMGSGGIYLVRTDAEGHPLWSSTFGGWAWEYGRSIRQTRDGGFVVAGAIASDFSSGSSDVYVLRLERESPFFRRGYVNDDDRLDLADAIGVLEFLFGEGDMGCVDAADVTDDGQSDIADAIYLLSFLFVPGSPPPPAPFPACGPDPTADGLGCESVPSCE
ncbi:MAG: PQQ-like beta-propeller repeat protein [Planctomycetes bacterium]|nr:PQQ-like beta-propeller repeat protein [Planctomycetota bacterium]